MGWKVWLCDQWEKRGGGLLVHLEQHSENSYGLPISASHYRRLMSARVAG